MGVIMKTALSIVLMLLFSFVTISTISANNQTEAVDAYMQQCAAELQVCNFNQNVFNELQEEADEFGYALTMDTVKDNHGEILYATIKLKYKYTMPLLGFESEHEATTIAR